MAMVKRKVGDGYVKVERRIWLVWAAMDADPTLEFHVAQQRVDQKLADEKAARRNNRAKRSNLTYAKLASSFAVSLEQHLDQTRKERKEIARQAAIAAAWEQPAARA
jgi:hypothetical protein